MSIRVRINGENRELEDTMSVRALVEFLDLKPKSIAVEINRCIIPKSRWEKTRLADGDEIEIVTFVGGG